MDQDDGAVPRCPRHPSESFTAFCSACLLERLAVARFPASSAGGSRQSDPTTGGISSAADVGAQIGEEERPRKTLLDLFLLDDVADGGGPAGSGASCGRSGTHETCSTNCHSESRLKRKGSLRRSCEWMACCETGKEESWAPSRQSWDGSAAPAAASASNSLACSSIGDKGAENFLPCSSSAENGRNWFYGLGKLWPGNLMNAAAVKNGGHAASTLDRSLSESCKDHQHLERISEVNHGHQRATRMNGNGLPDSGIAPNSWPVKGLHWLGRSRSVHFASPKSSDTRPHLWFYLTPLRSSRRLSDKRTRGNHNSFARGLFSGLRRQE